MSNRQARREQSRTLRAQRASGGGGRGTRRPTGGGGRRRGEASWIAQPFTLIAIGLAMVLGVVLVIVLVLGGGNPSDDAVVALEKAREDLPLELASGHKLGRDDAPVKLTQFEDFQCPFCLRYTADQEPTLVEEYVKTGKIQIIYEHFPALGLESAFSANAAFCAADQNKFWEFHNELFLVQAKAGQLDTERLNVGRFDTPKLKEMGRRAGIPDPDKFDECVDSTAHEEEITNQQRRARSLGITGTPGFLINGVPLGSGALANLDDWREVLNDAIAQMTSPTATTTPATAAPSPTSAGTTAPSPAATAQPTATRAP